MSTLPSLQVTPPESLTSSPPLTPPPTSEKASGIVNHIVTEIRARQARHSSSTEPWVGYPLSKDLYGELLREIQNDETLLGDVKQGLRHDYIPSRRRFFLRMPTDLHELVICEVVKDLQRQLRGLEGGRNPSANFAQAVDARGSATVVSKDPEYGRHDPDAQFRHMKAQYPGVVIEVSYAQKRKDLGIIAEDYILGSDGDIRVVIGLDIEYHRSKKATLSVWRPGVVVNEAGEAELVAEQTVVDQMFRDKDGNASDNIEAGIRLQLQDFATGALSGAGELDDPICIPARTLCLYLDKAEQNAAMLKENHGATRAERPWVRKRRREKTPPEELDDNREAKFQKIEEKVMSQADRDDSSYKTSDGE